MRRLRPMGIADILDEAVDIYRSNFVLLVGITAAVYVPWLLVAGWWDNTYIAAAADDRARLAASILPSLILSLVISPVVTCALAYAISERYLGRATSISACYQRVFSRSVLLALGPVILVKVVAIAGLFGALLFGLLRTTLAAGVTVRSKETAVALVGFAALVCMAVVVPLVLRLLLAETALIVERKKAWAALGRSWRMIAGYGPKAFWLILILVIALTILQGIVSWPTGHIIESRRGDVSQGLLVANILITTLIEVLLAPIGSIVMVLLYYDIRIRREGFDLEMLASDLDARARELPAGGVAALPQEQLPPQPPTEGP